MLTAFTQTKLKPTPHKVLAALDFFAITKEDYLSKEEKQKRLEAMNRVVLYSFINEDLRDHLSPKDIQEIEKMTTDINKIDLNIIIKFLNLKVKNFMEILEKKLLNLKKQLILSHYQKILERLERQQSLNHPKNFEYTLTVNRIITAIELDEWHMITSLVKQLPPNPPVTSG